MDCPICMENIQENISINKTTTECGHCFHTSCLMKNIAHNGFGCPYCRNILAEIQSNSKEINIIEEEEQEEEQEEINNIDQDYRFNDYELRAFRWLFNRANGNEIEIYENEKPYEEVYIDVYNEAEEIRNSLIPSSYIKKRMMKKKITYDQLLGHIFYVYNHNYSLSYENEDSFKKVFTTICEIENTYKFDDI